MSVVDPSAYAYTEENLRTWAAACPAGVIYVCPACDRTGCRHTRPMTTPDDTVAKDMRLAAKDDAAAPPQASVGDEAARLPYVKHGDWGFTHDPVHLTAVAQWRDAAVADGWSIEPTYGDSEPVERAARLTREGWVVQVLSRESTEAGKKHCAEISVWTPDGLAVKTPAFYSMGDLIARTRWCSRCKAADVDTQRVGFAGRVCEACIESARKEVETPGWNS